MTRRELLWLPGVGLGEKLLRGESRNVSFPLESIDGVLTPPEMFFVRDHFDEPELSLASWRLRIEGRVAKTMEWSLADLLESPARKIEAVLECAGNAAGGSAVSNGVWEGVSLAHLLQQAVPETGAARVMLEGADSGRLMPGAADLPYAQLVPLEKCLQPESLVAFKLNDRFLPGKNGFPARALFPGWYAMDSVKWLRRIVVLKPDDQPSTFEASGMKRLYNRIIETSPNNRTVTRLSQIQVKSAIAWPPGNSKLPACRHSIRGFAWSSAAAVRRVEFSSDGGHRWIPAKLETPSRPLGWVRWDVTWNAPAGDHILMSRATDSTGKTQPLQRDSARKDGYELNYCAPVRCSVR